ncbi:MAG TPA: type IX secretion system membrane protein PorP/SprF [Ferruginibacter sp.]|nr:type IX secretion system membrane protein PorP/SprF [Ferruginibacter sp.]
MRIKLLLSVLFFCLFAVAAKAQQIFEISQYMEHSFLYNPAAAGAGDVPSIGGIYRSQWAGIDGGPKTALLFGDTYFEKSKVGLGAMLYSDVTGPTSRTGGQVAISYSIDFQNGKRLMFGLAGRLLQFNVDKSKLQLQNTMDPILASSTNRTTGDADAGIYYKSPTLNAGIAADQLIQSKLNFINGSKVPGQLYTHYYFSADYRIKVDEDNVLTPNILFQYLPNEPLEFIGGLKLEYADLLWIGFSYHSQQSFTAFAGFKIDHTLGIGYAYEVYNTPISLFDGGGGSSNELMLKYYFHKKDPKVQAIDPL